MEGKTGEDNASGEDMEVESNEQQDNEEDTPLLPPEAFIHNKADRLKDDGGSSPAGYVSLKHLTDEPVFYDKSNLFVRT